MEHSNPRISNSWKHIIRRTLLDFLYKSLFYVKIASTVSLMDGQPDFFFSLFANIQKNASIVSYSLMNFYQVSAVANQEPEQKADTTLSPLEPSGYSLSVTAPHPKHSYHPVRWAVIKYILEGLCTIVRRTLIIREVL